MGIKKFIAYWWKIAFAIIMLGMLIFSGSKVYAQQTTATSLRIDLGSTSVNLGGAVNATAIALKNDGTTAIDSEFFATAISTSKAVGTALTAAGAGQRAIAVRTTSQPGNFKLTVTNAAGDIKAEADVAVTAVSVSVDISPRNPTIGIGQTAELTARVIGIATSNIEWASSDTTVATVSPITGDKTIVTGKMEGTVTITATETNTGVVAQTTIKVTSTLTTLSIGTGQGAPGAIEIVVPVTLTSSSGVQPVSLQMDIAYDPFLVTATGATAGAAATGAVKDVSFNVLSSSLFRIIVAGLNQNVIGNGVVANMKFNISPFASTGTVVTLQALSPIVSDANGNPITAEGKNGSLMIGILGDINNDGAINVLDVQLCINQALGVSPETASADMNGDGAVNVLDVQLVINKALGL